MVRSQSKTVISLWDSRTPLPEAQSIVPLEGAQHTIIHRAGADRYGFLHDAAVVVHGDTLFAAWYNCPEGEIEGEACIRYRTSDDGGNTWSEPGMLAYDREQRGVFYVPVAFLSTGRSLYAYVANMTGHDDVTQCEVFELVGNTFVSRGFIADRFLPNCAPVRMPNGDYIMAGRCAPCPGAKPMIPAVAVSKGEALTKPWRMVRLLPAGSLPDGRMLPYPETTVFVGEKGILALVRNDHGTALAFESGDNGETWAGPFQQDLPFGAAKMYAGALSTGQRYVIGNVPTGNYRDLLAIAVSRPGEPGFSEMRQLRRGYDNRLQAGPEWSYPCAVEHKGALYVAYTSEKRHCALSVIPLSSLAGG